MAQIRPSTQLRQDGATDGQAWKWDNTAGKYVPFTPAGANVARDRLTASTGNDTLTLGATPVANSPLIWVNGVLQWPTTDYTISGAVITFGSALTSGDVVEDYYLTGATSPGAAALSGSGGTSLRGVTLDFVNNASSDTIALPAGTAAGDMLVLFAGHGYNVSSLSTSGWTVQYNSGGTANFTGYIATKVATSGDITAGSVTVNFANIYFGQVGLAAVIGAGTVVGTQQSGPGGSDSGSVTLTSGASAASGDFVVYFASNRASSSDNTYDRGTVGATNNTDSTASASIASEAITASGTITVNITHSVVGSGRFDALVIVGP